MSKDSSCNKTKAEIPWATSTINRAPQSSTKHTENPSKPLAVSDAHPYLLMTDSNDTGAVISFIGDIVAQFSV